jgi:PAS domain S-box-containing protein
MWVLDQTRRIRERSGWARYPLTAAVVLLAFALRYVLSDPLEGYAFLHFYPAILFCAFVFDRGSGFLATVLSALLADYFFLDPVYAFSIAAPANVLALLVFVLVGFVIVASIESLWLTIDRLQSAEEMFREAFETAAVGKAQAEPRTGRFIRVNRHLCEMTGYSKEQLLRLSWSDLLHAEDRDRDLAAFRHALGTGAPAFTAERRYVRKDGGTFWVRVTGVFIRDRAGRTIRTNSVVEDISEQRRAQDRARSLAATLEQRVAERTEALRASQAALIQSQKLEAIGQFSAGVAHDFNNALTVIAGNLELLLDRVRDERDRHLLRSCRRAAENAESLTRDLLTFARRQPFRISSIDVQKTVTEIADEVEAILGEGVRLDLRLPDGIWPIDTDRHQLAAAILNIAANARDAMPRGGRFTIAGANRAVGEQGRIAELPDREYVEIALSDTGTGIPSEVLPRLFEPFFTTKAAGRGTGLGLPLVYSFVRQSGGTVTVSSEAGKGTTFRLLFPKGSALRAHDASRDGP